MVVLSGNGMEPIYPVTINISDPTKGIYPLKIEGKTNNLPLTGTLAKI